MAKMYKTAFGKQVDIDHLAASNEHTIAVGNMRVNARGDELGAGGKVIRTRDQIMKEYYALNSPVAADPDPIPVAQTPTPVPAAPQIAEPIVYNPASGLDEDEAEDTPVQQSVPSQPPIRAQNQVQQKKIVADSVELPMSKEVPVLPTAPAVPATMQEVVTAPAQSAASPDQTVLPQEVETDTTADTSPQLRGSLASSVAKGATITQVAKLPPKKANGVQRF